MSRRSRDQAKADLNSCLNAGRVVYTRHFREELANDGLTMQDVLTVCRAGAVIDEAEPDIRTGAWKYRIEGLTVERESVAVVFSFRPEDHAVCITVFKRR